MRTFVAGFVVSLIAGWIGLAGFAQAQSATAPDVTADRTTDPEPAPPVNPASASYVLVTTSKGNMVFELDADRAPGTVANFLRYVDDNFYDGTLFHRVMKDSVIQGGGFSIDMVEKPTKPPIVNEAGNGLKHSRGSLAMARRRAPDSATSQFFINLNDNVLFDRIAAGHGYTVFGRVVAGMATADAIGGVDVHENKNGEVSEPFNPPVITSVRRISLEQAKPFIDAEAAAGPVAASQPAATQPTPAIVYAVISTNKGDILLELDHAKAPITVDNFLMYIRNEFYNGTVFHRVIPNFMIQGGGMDERMTQKKTSAPIKNEWTNGLKNQRGTIAMARLGGKADSATSQFFINLVSNGSLDQPNDGAAYAVFGKVAAGMAVVDVIAKSPIGPNQAGERSQPLETITITSVKRVSDDDAKKMIAAESKPATP